MRLFYVILFLYLSMFQASAQLVIRSDGSWQAVGTFQNGWTNPWFNDATWPTVQSPSPWIISPVVPGSQSMWVSPFSDTAYFRKSFFLKGDCVSSSCQISADNEFELYLNDSLVGTGSNLGLIYSYNLTPFLRIGKNTIAIKAVNWNTGPYLVSFLANVDYTSAPVIQMSGNDTLCPGLSSTFQVYPNYAAYRWNTGDTTKAISVSDGGLYFVEATDNNACKWVDSARLIVHKPKPLSIGPDQNICEGESIRLSASGFVSYVWNVESQDSSISVSKSGTYGLEALDSNGCKSSDSMRLRVFSFADISLGNDRVLCKGDTARIIASFPQSVYEWNTGSQKSEISVKESGNYRVTITNFCGSASDDVNIFFTDLSDFSLMDDTVICEGTSIVLDAKVEKARYEWSTGDTSESIRVSEPGTYALSVFDNCGNNAYDEVNIYGQLDYELIIPNAFTPNLDGLNEGYRMYLPKDVNFKMSIFDRWGRQVFSAEDPEDYWDGTFKGENLPSGVYVYEMSYFDCLYQLQLENGTITLIR